MGYSGFRWLRGLLGNTGARDVVCHDVVLVIRLHVFPDSDAIRKILYIYIYICIYHQDTQMYICIGVFTE